MFTNELLNSPVPETEFGPNSKRYGLTAQTSQQKTCGNTRQCRDHDISERGYAHIPRPGAADFDVAGGSCTHPSAACAAARVFTISSAGSGAQAISESGDRYNRAFIRMHRLTVHTASVAVVANLSLSLKRTSSARVGSSGLPGSMSIPLSRATIPRKRAKGGEDAKAVQFCSRMNGRSLWRDHECVGHCGDLLSGVLRRCLSRW
jgi:hypothetical protein